MEKQKVDYLIVGFGIAGISLAYQLEREGKRVAIIDSKKVGAKASIVAAGLYNPVILKRFTLAWNANEQLEYAKYFYKDLEAYLKISAMQSLPVYRKFHSAEEQNNWFSEIDKPQLAKYLSPYLKNSIATGIDAPFKYGEVMQTGRLDIAPLLKAYRNKFFEKGLFLEESIDYKELVIGASTVFYKNFEAKRIVFCEGYGMCKNPFFNQLPLVGNKGSYLIIKSKKLKLKGALKAHFFIIPLGNDLYKFGATYSNYFQDLDHDNKAKEELVAHLKVLINVPFTIEKQVTGVRPTVIDRRPLVGQHKIHKPLYILNGMGTRGVMIAPTATRHLVQFMEKGIMLPSEIDIQRFQE